MGMPENNTEDKTAEVKPVTYNPSLFELADDGDDNILRGSENSLFDETVLHTPMVQEDQTDPMKKFFTGYYGFSQICYKLNHKTRETFIQKFHPFLRKIKRFLINKKRL